MRIIRDRNVNLLFMYRISFLFSSSGWVMVNFVQRESHEQAIWKWKFDAFFNLLRKNLLSKYSIQFEKKIQSFSLNLQTHKYGKGKKYFYPNDLPEYPFIFMWRY